LKVDGPRFTAREDTPEEVLDFVDAAHRPYLHGSKRLQEANRKRGKTIANGPGKGRGPIR
jgi:hypothetical protein